MKPVATPRFEIVYNGIKRKCKLIEQKMDKYKLSVLDEKGNIILTDWFQNNQIRRFWS